MSLLRAPTTPDPETDQGKHSFSLAIMPHVGRLEDGATYEQARAFTSPVYSESHARWKGGADITQHALARSSPTCHSSQSQAAGPRVSYWRLSSGQKTKTKAEPSSFDCSRV